METLISEKLLNEFRGDEGSFITSIRCDLKWDHDKFIYFLECMKNYCKCKQSEDTLDKEITQGFWFVSWFIKDWTSDSAFRNANRFCDDYYIQSYELIHNLSYWYFMEESIYIEEESYDEELRLLESYIR